MTESLGSRATTWMGSSYSKIYASHESDVLISTACAASYAVLGLIHTRFTGMPCTVYLVRQRWVPFPRIPAIR
ncbi:hypothetical protein VTJ04DRAFT_8182 [Mycothermus thermophilus]|uniref:uncharacterized protein n=1 Tax=Humicola insolens TaxID=85995 RepID=UPI0037428E8A